MIRVKSCPERLCGWIGHLYRREHFVSTWIIDLWYGSPTSHTPTPFQMRWDSMLFIIGSGSTFVHNLVQAPAWYTVLLQPYIATQNCSIIVILYHTKRGRNELFFILASSKMTAENIYYKDNFGSGSGSDSRFQNNFDSTGSVAFPLYIYTAHWAASMASTACPMLISVSDRLMLIRGRRRLL